MYGGGGPAKQGKILLNLALCPANLYLEVGKYAIILLCLVIFSFGFPFRGCSLVRILVSESLWARLGLLYSTCIGHLGCV